MTSVVEWGAFVELDKDGWYATIALCQHSHVFTVTICCQVCIDSRFRGACVKTHICKISALFGVTFGFMMSLTISDQRHLRRKHRGVHLSWAARPGESLNLNQWVNLWVLGSSNNASQEPFGHAGSSLDFFSPILPATCRLL